MSVTEGDAPRPLPPVSMRDLLAASAAATAVSTPPRAPEPRVVPERAQEPKAA
ncbi:MULTISPECIES: hypothetical protein [Streptomyces]|uniref:Uncharacterized protein n=1 Tax=Streptomyces fuscus TaxID=3048495 RepID=A0ABT7IYT8_9ACTN|nr:MULTISPECIES: hypothetical protein [Streptomyces]MCM1970313.1 hypothetical protein [Streptomyces sp. G1]MDL2077763.1 hypothetical protein [Streptomyces fuscus]SBT90658.1 hypothetical protein GA0115233_102113 [Streptomyces sp. DI166]